MPNLIWIRNAKLRLAKIRLKAGLITDLDVTNAAANIAGTQANVPTLQLSERKMIHALAVLIGQNPETLYSELSAPVEIPASSTEPAIGSPSALLRRRPDIRQAERNLAAATERVGVRVSSLFPTISLSARAGGQSGKFGNLATSAASFFQFGPQINWGILNYPAARQDLRTYRSRQEQQYLDYKQTVLVAFEDVDDSLVSYDSEKARYQSLQEQVHQNQRSVSVAVEKYRRGLTNFLNVLDAQRSLLSSENAAIECRANLSVDLVALYKAAGGGWQTTYPVSVNSPVAK